MKDRDEIITWLKTLSEDEQERCVWELTGFPAFFSPKEGEIADDCFIAQLAEVKRKLEAGESVREQLDDAYASLDDAMERFKTNNLIEQTIEGTIKELNEVD